MTDCERLRVIFAGTPDFAARALQALLESEHQVVGVLTQPDRPAGRGRELKASPVKALALQHQIPLHQPASFNAAEGGIDAVAKLNGDVMVVAAYGIILPAAVLSLPSLGCLNIHASLLPRWRGAAPIQRALLAGDAESGVCIMQMDEGLDTGDVIATARMPLTSNMTGGELHDALAELGATTLVDVLAGYCRKDLQAVPQAKDGVTYAKKIDKAEAALDFSASAVSLHRKIQAFNPWPCCDALLDGVRYRIWRSKVPSKASIPATAVVGQVLCADDNGIRVATANGVLDILEIQKPGKKTMLAAEFSRGTDLTGKVFK